MDSKQITVYTLQNIGYSYAEANQIMRRFKDSFEIRVKNVRHDVDGRVLFTDAVSLTQVVKFLEYYVPGLENRKHQKPNKWKKLLNQMKRMQNG